MSGNQTGTLADLKEALALRQAAAEAEAEATGAPAPLAPVSTQPKREPKPARRESSRRPAGSMS